ncbi:MAG: hypothetical protein IKF90_18995 [Parasporobacterium sp.]|nr:hypothetical protein [Parasporobacterium sp.]
MSFGKTVVKLAVVAGVAYGGYYLYKKYIKKDAVPQQDFDELADVTFDYDEDAAKEESFADKIKAAAEKQLDKIK